MKQAYRGAILGIILFLTLGFFAGQSAAQGTEDTPEVVVLTAEGAVTPIMADYISRGLELALKQDAAVAILELDTPGGSIDVMNTIIKSIRSSPIPVVVYVAPRNAMAASAGTIITLAGHVAAMAPETTIGAASPVGSQGEDIGDTMESKVKEILRAEARTLTRSRGKEATSLAEETIESARAVTADEALETGLVDIIAVDVKDLLVQLDGRVVEVNGEELILQTRNAVLLPVENTFIERILQLLVNPNLVFLLLSIGVQAILIELSSPGGWVAGFIGIICLMLAIYGLGILPVNWFGILFMLIAFVLFILEIKAPAFGALTIAGAVSFIAGALVLFNSVRMPGFPPVSVPLVVATGLILAASFFAIITFAIRVRHAPVRTGRESLPGQVGIARSEINPRGTALVAGELWVVEADPEGAFIEEGARVVVTEVEGLRLRVRKV
ncbi:MAG: nodulation protein NfeD [Anaerolineaceae bacterium]|nr:nodulation protein NfeD [Anaerolineaceae bacterium]